MTEQSLRSQQWNWDGFSVATLNVQSMVGKFNFIFGTLEENQLDVLCVQEAGLEPAA